MYKLTEEDVDEFVSTLINKLAETIINARKERKMQVEYNATLFQALLKLSYIYDIEIL